MPYNLLDSDRSWDRQPLLQGRHGHERPYGKDSVLEVASQLLLALRNFPIFQLQREVSNLTKTIQEQGRTIEAQGLAISEIKSIIEPPTTKRDEYAIWVESKDADKYAGMYVAFVPGEGPIDSASTLKELRAKMTANPLAKKAAIVTVPNAAF